MAAKISKPAHDWSDINIEVEISSLQQSIMEWAQKHELWYDCGFKSQLERSQCEPSSDCPVVTCFYAEAMNLIVYSDLESEFNDLLEGLGYWYEHTDSVTLELYAIDEMRAAQFYEYFRWKWVCSLLIEDTGDVYEELYSYFAKRPMDLHRLHWRDFEMLLFRIFQNHGYRAILGPGRADGGVDLRLWQENPIGDILTVVQAKRYSPHNKIDAVPVQALYGVSKVDNASQAIFVTTSSYTPAARNFAARVSSELHLADKEQIISWCEKATHGVIQDKSTLVSREYVERLIARLAIYPDSRIVHSTWGFNMCHNRYAVVIKETKHAALLLSISQLKVQDDGYGTRGLEVPRLDASTIQNFNEVGVIRALRSVDNQGGVSYWDGQQLYSAWNKQPNRFDYMD